MPPARTVVVEAHNSWAVRSLLQLLLNTVSTVIVSVLSVIAVIPLNYSDSQRLADSNDTTDIY